MIKKKAVWLSFDLGVGGDYSGLYRWLDNHHAIECGDGLAFFTYEIDSSEEYRLKDIIKQNLVERFAIRPGDRLYIIRMEFREGSYKVVGDFIEGARRGARWEGYGDTHTGSSEEGE